MHHNHEEYLTVAELSARIKYSVQSIYNMIYNGTFVKGQHYLKPSGKKVLFIWRAVQAWIERDNPENTPKTTRIRKSRIKI
jgi:predicted DNA-binding transcriptional regulator AlpA